MIGIIFSLFLLWKLYRWFFPVRAPHVLDIYFGVPGSGKTTFAAWFTRQSLKEAWPIKLARRYPCRLSSWLLNKTQLFKRRTDVYSNVPIKGSYRLDPQHDVGFYQIADGKVIIDEAGIEYNNRNFKSFPAAAIYWYKYHRHYECSVDVFSQSFEDMDITLRRLAQNYYVVSKSLIPFFVVARKIKRKVGIDDMTHQIVDKYYFGFLFFGCRWVFMPSTWKYFDSYTRREMPEKPWSKWS